MFQDPDRTERLVRRYNDTYNTLRLRSFDGSHLTFPGMNPAVTPYPHQKDAVWRVMSGGNTLLAHAVGAGKTLDMAAAGMKMKQAGLIRRALYVVPNHMLEQFGREFLHLYPNARLLIAGKEDFTRERRKLLTAKIASGDWDGIVMTHSSFERIGMSRAYQADVPARADRRLRGPAEGRRTRRPRVRRPGPAPHRQDPREAEGQHREERLRDLLAADKKDDGLVFDELGVDHLFIDESHYFKNLETPTKMDRVAGIQTGGSERAFDLYLKCRYLDRQHPGHGVTFATGTPISNTMVELYTLQRYLDARGLAERGIEHFDAWAATFGEVVDAMEISPDGRTLRPRSRFAKFVNLPELQQMFRAFADVKTAEMLPASQARPERRQALRHRLPDVRGTARHPGRAGAALRSHPRRQGEALGRQRPGRHHGRPQAGPRCPAALRPGARLPRLQDQRPGGERRRHLGTHRAHARHAVDLLGSGRPSHALGLLGLPGRHRQAGQRRHPPRADRRIGDADTDAKKQVLFDKVRSGQVRVLLGSTQKMGTGTNVQQRLVALHHLDAPWKPAEVEQRDGRILRQGNGNDEVEIYRYVTEGSFDAYMWQALETKATFISQVMTGDLTVRQAEDIGGQELSYAEVKAIASGNPAVLTLAEADAEIKRLQVLKKHHADEQYVARKRLKELPADIARLEARRDALSADLATARAHAHDPVTIGDRRYAREEALDALGERLNAIPGCGVRGQELPARRLSRPDLQPRPAPPLRACRPRPGRGHPVPGAFPRASRPARRPERGGQADRRLRGRAGTDPARSGAGPGAAAATTRPASAAASRQAAYLEALTALRRQLEAALSETPSPKACRPRKTWCSGSRRCARPTPLTPRRSGPASAGPPAWKKR